MLIAVSFSTTNRKCSIQQKYNPVSFCFTLSLFTIINLQPSHLALVRRVYSSLLDFTWASRQAFSKLNRAVNRLNAGLWWNGGLHSGWRQRKCVEEANNPALIPLLSATVAGAVTGACNSLVPLQVFSLLGRESG